MSLLTLQQFIDKWLGQKADFDGAYDGQCVDLYRYYVKECWGFPQSPGVGGASEIWDSAGDEYEYILDGPGKVPSPGDIIIWNRKAGGGFGHVAICVKASLNSSKFTSFDQNWPTLNKCTLTEHTYTNVIGWMHPKENMANELEICMKDRQKFWDERDDILRVIGAPDVETGKSMVGGYKSRITDLTGQLGTAQAEMVNREEQVSRLKLDAANLEKEKLALIQQLKTKQEEINQFAKDKGALAIENGKLAVQVETLTQQVQQGSITLTWGDVFKLLLQQKITIDKK